MPFLTGFGKRKELRYGTVFPGANLTDFPKLFVITSDSDIAAELSGGGGIAVTAADETTLVPFGLYPSSDPTSGDLILRAKFSPLTAATTGDVIGYLYYDAGETTVEDKAGTVSNSYALFMPLEEDPSGSAPQIYDWVSEANVGTSAGTMTSGNLVAGQVGNGLDFDGTNDEITLTGGPTSGSVTVEAIAHADTGSQGESMVSHTNTGSPTRLLDLGLNAGGTRGRFQVFDGTNNPFCDTTTVINTSGFHYIAGVRDAGTQLRIYYNGAQEGSTSDTSSSFDNGSQDWRIGRRRDTFGGFFDGQIDEVRISTVVRSADWLEYAYEDDFNNSDTFTLGPEEVDGGGPPVGHFGRLVNSVRLKSKIGGGLAA